MKKLSLILLLLALVLATAIACQESDDPKDTADSVTTDAVTTDGAAETTKEPETEPPVTLAGSDGVPVTDEALHGWFEYGGNLTLRDKFTVGARDSISISMAKNEMEGFQYILASNKSYDGLRCEVSTLTDGNGNTLEGTVHVAWNVYVDQSLGGWSRGFTPTALLEQDDPYQGGTFDIVSGRSKTLYVLYKTDVNTVPGVYTGRLEIKQGDRVILDGEVSVTVWNIYYDEKTECITNIGYGFSWDWWEDPAPASAPDCKVDPHWQEAYADFLLSYRMSPGILPYNSLLTDDIAAKYLDNPRTTLVSIMFGYLYTLKFEDRLDELVAQYEAAEANGWLDKINLCIGDEPKEIDAVDNDKVMAELLSQYYPTTRFGVPTYVPLTKDDKNLIERYAEFSTLHIPKKRLLQEEPELLASCQKLKEERDDTVLWYVAGNEEWNAIDVLPCIPSTLQRIMFWQQYQNDIDGFLVWQTNYWEGYPDFWAEGYEETKPGPSAFKEPTGNGCAVLWNPTNQQPLPTFNAEGLRDGIEDFQLMRMAEEVIGKDTVMEMVERITTSISEYTTDAELLAQVRNELAEALLTATAQ